MEMTTYERGNKLYYKIDKYEKILEKTFINHGYIKSDDAYIKSFQLTFPYREKIVQNYLRDAESMFYEEAGLKPMRWQEGFTHFASIAKKSGLDWWTMGKILLPLYGIDAEINDVDFCFHLRDLNKICDAFSDYIIEPVVRETHRSSAYQYYGLAYSHCTICILVEPQESLDFPEPVHFGQYASNNLKSVDWNGHHVKVPPIELYIKTLKRWGKTEYAQSIENAIIQKSTNI